MAVVYVHIGEPKTGTTALQRRLAAGRAELRKQGVLYPGTEINHFYASLAACDIFYAGGPGDDAAWKGILGEIARWDGTVVLSSEVFCWADESGAQLVADDLRDHDVRIVHTIRPFDRLLPSAYQEDVKNGRPQQFGRWLELIRRGGDKPGFVKMFWAGHEPGRIIAAWTAAFSPDDYRVVVVPSRQHGNLFDRLAAVMGFEIPAMPDGGAASNRSLTAAETEAVRRVHSLVDDRLAGPERQQQVKQYLADLVMTNREPGETETAIRLPESSRPWLEEWSRAATEAIRRAGVDVTGSLSELEVSPDLSLVPEVIPPDPDQVAQVLADVGVTLLAERAHNRRRIVALRDEVAGWTREAARLEQASTENPIRWVSELVARVKAVLRRATSYLERLRRR